MVGKVGSWREGERADLVFLFFWLSCLSSLIFLLPFSGLLMSSSAVNSAGSRSTVFLRLSRFREMWFRRWEASQAMKVALNAQYCWVPGAVLKNES